MIIANVNSGRKAEYSLSGTNLTVDVPEVGSLTVDLQDKQQENKRTVNISLDKSYDRFAEGVGAWYVANIIVPGKSYELVDTGEVDEEGEPIMKRETLPLDMSKVELHLWGLPESVSEKIKEQEEQEGEDN